MKILITCGPASEPIDAVRRITNHSTGELGAKLAELLAQAGHEVYCIRGVGATVPPPLAPVKVIPFTGNDELLEVLAHQTEIFDVVLHAAALADFTPYKMLVDGVELTAGFSGKIRSSTQELQISFRPAKKVIRHLRTFFPTAWIVGWKYEVAGTLNESLDNGKKLLQENSLDACVVNGPALKTEMIWMPRKGENQRFVTKEEFLLQFPDLLTKTFRGGVKICL